MGNEWETNSQPEADQPSEQPPHSYASQPDQNADQSPEQPPHSYTSQPDQNVDQPSEQPPYSYTSQPDQNAEQPPTNTPYVNPNFFQQEDLDKRIEDIRRIVSQGANEAQQRLRRVVDRANEYWQQAQTTQSPRHSANVEEYRLRQLVNAWSNENWRVTHDLGTYMDIVSQYTDEIWSITLQTRWETRGLDIISEPYEGQAVSMPKPLLPIWDYTLPEVVGLKPPQTRTRLENMEEIVSCTNCNGTGHVLCSTCSGRGWIVCPECKGRTKRRCTTCRGRGYVSDWAKQEKKPFFRKQAENVASSIGGKVFDLFDNIRQQGVPIPNPADSDPATKGPTIPCPDCVNGEVDCSCGNGKRVCPDCQGARNSLCSACSGTGKLVRHREIVREFNLGTQTRLIGEQVIPAQQLAKASGELIYNVEVSSEPLFADVPPERVPLDVWRTTVDMVNTEQQSMKKPGTSSQTGSRPTLQVIELVRVPFTKLQYRFNDQDYVLYIYDGEG
ncbi:MAG TPA: hypothetical protein VH593_24325, partial [Ktedonobacteraceae bacterium]